MFYSVIETRDFSLFNQSAQALLKGYFIKLNINAKNFFLYISLCYIIKNIKHFFLIDVQLCQHSWKLGKL